MNSSRLLMNRIVQKYGALVHPAPGCREHLTMSVSTELMSVPRNRVSRRAERQAEVALYH